MKKKDKNRLERTRQEYQEQADRSKTQLDLTIRKATDSLMNAFTGMGTSSSKRGNTFAQASVDSFNFIELENLYSGNSIATKVVDIPAEDATKKWREISGKNAEAVKEAEEKLNVKEKLTEALKISRLYGGCAVLMITNQDLEEPLDLKKAQKGSLENLVVLDRWEIFAGDFNNYDLLDGDFGEPEYWTVSRSGNVKVHKSHFIFVKGLYLPRRLKERNGYWDGSILARVMDDIKDACSAKYGIAESMYESNVNIIKNERIAQAIEAGNDDIARDLIARRLERSNGKDLFLNRTDEFIQATLNLSGAAQTLETLMTWVAGVCNIPVTKMWGTSATGLSATGEGDLKNYHEDIQRAQESLPLGDFNSLLVKSATGEESKDYSFEWNPLGTPTEKEQAEAIEVRSRTDQVYVDMGAVGVEQIQEKLKQDGVYGFSENQLKEKESPYENIELEQGE